MSTYGSVVTFFVSIVLNYLLPGTGFFIYRHWILGFLFLLLYQIIGRLFIHPIWMISFKTITIISTCLLAFIEKHKTQLLVLFNSYGLDVKRPPLEKKDALLKLRYSQQAWFNYFKEELRQENFIDTTSGYLYRFTIELLCTLDDAPPEKTIKTLITLYREYKNRVDYAEELPEVIGLSLLAFQGKKKALPWLKMVNETQYINFIISYYNLEGGLEKLPWRYWELLLPEEESIAKNERDSFAHLLLYLNHRVKEETKKTLLDLLNRRKIYYNKRNESIYAHCLKQSEQIQKIYLTPYKEYLFHDKTETVLQHIHLFSLKKGQLEVKELEVPQRIRYYLKDYQKSWEKNKRREEKKSAPPIQEKEVQRSRRRVIQLDEVRIKRTLKEQREMAAHLADIFSSPKEEKRKEKNEKVIPIKELEDIFQMKPQKNPPQMTLEEKELIEKLLKKNSLTQQEIKDILKEGCLLNNLIDSINNKFYETLSDTLLEQREEEWMIKEEYRELAGDLLQKNPQ